MRLSRFARPAWSCVLLVILLAAPAVSSGVRTHRTAPVLIPAAYTHDGNAGSSDASRRLMTLTRGTAMGTVSGEVGDPSFDRTTTLAAETGARFDIAPRVLDQLNDARLGPLQGKLTTSDLQRLAVNPDAKYLYDARTGNINVIQEVDGRLLRITTPRNANTIISVGPIRANQVENLIKRGDYVPIDGGG